MNPENKKAAREKRAAEKEHEKKMRMGKLAALVVVIVLAVILLLWGLSRSGGSGTGKSGQETGAASQSQDSKNTDQKAGGQKTENAKTSGSGTSQSDSVKADPNYRAQKGDTVAIHYVGKVGETAFYGGTGDYDLKLGSGSFIAGFEDQVIGHKKGETFDVHVTFPDNYRSSYAMREDGQADTSKPITLANADATFTVTIKEMK